MKRWLLGIGMALSLSGLDVLTSSASAQTIVVHGTHSGGLHHYGHPSYGYYPPYHYGYRAPYGYYPNHYYSPYRPPIIRYPTAPGQIGIYPDYGFGVPSTASTIYGYRSARPSYNSGIPSGGAWGVGY